MTVKRHGIGRNTKVAKLVAGAEPKWNVLMPSGEWYRADWGVMKCDRGFFQSCIDNWKKVGSPELPIDRFHWGSSNETAVTDPRAKAAVGWIQDLRINANGDLEGLCAWNADGKADIDADRFRYFSPEWHEDAFDAASGTRQGPTFFGGSLLNDPYFRTLPPLAASDPAAQENVMTREELIELYGLSKTASDADIKAAAKKSAEALRTAAEADEKRTASDKRTGELEAELKAAKESREASDKRIAALEEEAKKSAEAALKASTEALCAKLEREGRIVAAEKADVADDVKTYGLVKATERWTKRSPVVKLGELGIPGDSSVDDVTPEDAHRQLTAKADELVKTGAATRGSATEMAMLQNPRLAFAASKLTAAKAPKASA